MSEPISTSDTGVQRLLLLRHGEVLSHRGDVSVSEQGLDYAKIIGRRLGAHEAKLRILSGETRRTRETAQALADGAHSIGSAVTGPDVCFAMRNPDLYVAGARVNLVSSVDTLAAQIKGFSVEQCARVPFFQEFFAHPDRIEYWLHHRSPPGENSVAVSQRVVSFATSLLDWDDTDTLFVAVTHSPVLRACALDQIGEDPGEPYWVSGLALQVFPDGTVHTKLISEVQ